MTPYLFFFVALAVTTAVACVVICLRERRKRRVRNVDGRCCTNCKHRDSVLASCYDCIAFSETTLEYWQPRKEPD